MKKKKWKFNNFTNSHKLILKLLLPMIRKVDIQETISFLILSILKSIQTFRLYWMEEIIKSTIWTKSRLYTVIWNVKFIFLKSPPQAPLGSRFCTDPPLKMFKIFGRGGSVGKPSDVPYDHMVCIFGKFGARGTC